MFFVSIFQTTSDNKLSLWTKINRENHKAYSNIGDNSIDESIKNLSIIAQLTKSTKSNLAKFKKLDLTISKKSSLSKDFAKANSIRTDFFTPEIKKTFIYL